jgi:hypothetical protein
MLVLLVLIIVIIVTPRAEPKDMARFENPEHSTANFWHDVKFVPDPNDSSGKKGIWQGWFHQDNVDGAKLDQGIIRARVEGKWQDFPIVQLPPDFLKWNFDRRLAQLAHIKQLLENQRSEMPEIAGPHNGIVASHGLKRNDSYWTINNAVKGMGWLPKRDKLSEIIQLLRRTWQDSTPKKLRVLESLYQNGAEIFDLSKQTSLELYSQPGFETHTFLNQMADPGVAIVFLDLPKSYELRCIAQMLHPDDPNLTDYEKQVVEYINLIHDYFHGESPRRAIGVIYSIVQVFDNSPGNWRGQRVVPAQEK